MKSAKKCRRCRRELPIEIFVDVNGESNKRGAYCRPCHLERMEEWRLSALAEEASHIPKLQIVYGTWWKHYAIPEDFRQNLLDERDYCPYCNTKFSEVVPNTFNPTLIHLDHMDPLSLGGEHSIRNTIYCCGPCNIKKGDSKFTKWLQILSPEIRESVRNIYINKHGNAPEEFEEGRPMSKGIWPEMAIYSSFESLKVQYPEPVVTGPPSNKPLTITISLTVHLDETKS